MRIGIDIDSTLHHHWPLVAAAAARRFGVELRYEEQFPWAERPLTDEQLRACVEDTHADEAIAGVRPYPHAVETVNRWFDAGHFIHVTSRRPERSLPATLRGLEATGLRPHAPSGGEHKTGRCRELATDLPGADRPQSLRRALGAGMPAAPLRHPWNPDVCDSPQVVC